ncbi:MULTISPECIES: orotidine-5'-phosphate decarboxylase [Microbacterium]|uniref:Orotidine-5'-phosphate decarboxylase n=1 Tax=Microbacterium commune TaxID=2762219 RepID=A0ABR8W6A8_9MICO|nr:MULTISPECIES: orotidine-5'-phosphate decarboxylase [Microbacterium]MBD8012548.1 orotidine-5'-phosphate decarboxylase [Microbacterium commune]OIU87081.1 orotidine 5'-phosphate decarboxylase [Microbacterium sp. AR7-10]
MTESFGARLRAAMDRFGPLCVGIDPHAALLDQWGLAQDADGLRSFGLAVVDAAAGRAAVVKPQVAFFERFGSRGYAALEDIMAAARDAGLIVLADAKRGDIGSTMAGYAAAWLEAGSPLEADAVTISPYLGPESLRETLTTAVRADKGVFVLAATSNPEAAALQTARTVDVAGGDEQTVAARVTRDVTWVNRSAAFEGALGPVGVVIGATVDRAEVGIGDEILAGTPILAPGFGAQGATEADLTARFGPVAANVLASESRSILSMGAAGIAETISIRNQRYQEVLRG